MYTLTFYYSNFPFFPFFYLPLPFSLYHSPFLSFLINFSLFFSFLFSLSLSLSHTGELINPEAAMSYDWINGYLNRLTDNKKVNYILLPELTFNEVRTHIACTLKVTVKDLPPGLDQMAFDLSGSFIFFILLPLFFFFLFLFLIFFFFFFLFLLFFLFIYLFIFFSHFTSQVEILSGWMKFQHFY